MALGENSGKRVLVYGCGNDHAAVWFSKSGYTVDAIDISPKSVENQKEIAKILGLKIRAIVMDAHSLDFQSNEYDIVYGNAILHHLELEKAMPEIVRVLKPGGKAVFRDVMAGNFFLKFFRFATPFWRTPDEHPLTGVDLDFISKSFLNCHISNYVLSGQPYFFFAREINRVILRKLKVKGRIPLHNSIWEKCDKLDRFLYRFFPFLKKQAWLCLIIGTKEE